MPHTNPVIGSTGWGTVLNDALDDIQADVDAKAELTDVFPTSTTAALEDVADAINTTGKFAGKGIFNTTTGIPAWATGSAAADDWNDATGASEHAPV